MLRASIKNPRRSPRIPLRSAAVLTHKGGSWSGEVEDLGGGGCLVRSSRPLDAGTPLRVLVHHPDGGPPLNVEARVAWSEGARAGLSFAARGGPLARSANDPAAWFKRIVAARPRLAAALARVPDELFFDTPLYFLPAPRTIVDLAPDERLLIASGAHGMMLDALLARSGLGQERMLRALFALFEKGVLTLSLGQASDPWRWRALALQEDAAAPLPALERRRISCGAPPPPRVQPVDAEEPPARAVARAPVAPAPQPAVVQANLLRGASASRRSTQAQALFDAGCLAAREGRVHEAVARLRVALSMAPRDPEIARAIGQLAFQDR